MARISIEVGHGGNDYGAVSGTITEKNINLVVAIEVKYHLERHGQEVLISRLSDVNDKAQDFYPKAKAWKPDVGISVHTNAFNGTAKGFEAYYRVTGEAAEFKDKSVKLCTDIENEVKKIGQNSRGIKQGQFLMQALSCPSAYCELGFLDNPEDYNQFDTPEKQKNFGKAYAKGILKYLGVTWKDENAEKFSSAGSDYSANPSNKIKIIYRVISGSFSQRENAEAWAKELKIKGFDSFLETLKLNI